jgi:citronellol/citronellal dehydrogenase
VEFALGGNDLMRRSRRPEIMADAAHAILCTSARENTGRFLIDEDVLVAQGVVDFDQYRNDPLLPLQHDLFVDPSIPIRSTMRPSSLSA